MLIFTKQIIDNKETFEDVAIGNYIEKRVPYITYKEKLDDEVIQVRIKLDKENVRIRRTGSVKMDFLFVLHETTQNIYETKAGRTIMDITTTKLEYVGDDLAGHLTIHYRLQEQETVHGEFKFELHYKEQTE